MGEIRRRRRGRLAPRDETEARLEATRAIGWAVKNLKVLRILFIIDAVLMGLVALLASGAGVDTLAYIALGCGLLAVGGAIFVVQQPAAWSLVLAIAHSVPAVFAIWIAGLGFVNVNSILSVLLAVLLWLAVNMALKTTRLLAQYPDVWAARRMRGEVRTDDTMGSKHRDAARKRAQKRNLTIVGVVGGVALVIAALVAFKGNGDDRPGGGTAAPRAKPTIALEKTAGDFAEAWGLEGMAGISPFIADPARSRIARGFNRMIRRHEWNREAFPPISNMRIETVNDWVSEAHFDVKDYGTMRSSWEWDKDRWLLYRVKFKRAE
ncbi:MAG: hypothetical protein QNJ98_06370 [Planctomycetota bacterium]|nr:hypothetical protein [Planctomycetota bacterium]